MNKSFAKVYNKPESQKAHHVEPTKLEEGNPIRIEFTLPKKMMSYMTLDALDCDTGEIIARVTDALAKGISEKARWIYTISQDPSLNPVLKRILEVEPKKRLRCSRDFVASLQRKVQGGILTYISKQIKEDRLVKDDWDTFIERKERYDTEKTKALRYFKNAEIRSLRDIGRSLYMSRSSKGAFKKSEFTLLPIPPKLDHLFKRWPNTQTLKTLSPTLYIKEKHWGDRISAISTGPPAISEDRKEDPPDTS